ncbi:GntR family transcriptional regulator [Propionibacterium sp.]|uniref:GntR family transcriptional regulator n=1 Tax=Propionibacterium sp. TaxID=1977903 RepID=UPI0039E84528
MAELADARLVLEPGAIERAMRHPDDLLSELEASFRNHERAATELLMPEHQETHQYLRKYFETDWSFHEVILQNCGNRYIAQAVDALSFRVHRMRQTIGIGATDAPIAVAEHRAILEAVRHRDSDEAIKQMRIHLANLEVRVATNDSSSE